MKKNNFLKNDFLEIESSIDYNDKNKRLDVFLTSLKKLVKEVIKEDFKEEKFLEILQKKLPIITYSGFKKPPFLLSFTTLNYGEHSWGVGRFVADEISNWLIPGKQMLILGSQSLNFKFSKFPKSKFYIMEYFIHIEDEKDLKSVKKNIDKFVSLLRVNILSVYKAKYILSKKKLTKEEKKALVKENISRLLDEEKIDIEKSGFDQMQHLMTKLSFEKNIDKVKKRIDNLLDKRRKFADRYIYENFSHIVKIFKEDFIAKRDPPYVSKVLSFFYLLQKIFKKTFDDSPDKRHITIKFIKTKSCVGIFLFLNLIKETEHFEKKHFINAIKSSFSNINYIENSLVEDRENRVISLFLEVEKEDKTPFSTKELKELKNNLSSEVVERIVNFRNSLFVISNEEEIMKNILLLSEQIKYVKDDPQLIISYDNQNDEKLFFRIILLRLVQKNASSIEEKFLCSDTELQFIADDVKEIGSFKRYKKEANIFKVAVDKKCFYRKDFSLDLQKAKKFIKKELYKVIGRYRDFHGEMLSVQSEALESLKKVLSKSKESEIQNFFYSIEPNIMQSIVDVDVFKNMFFLLKKVLKKEIDNFSVESCSLKNYLLLAVSSKEKSFKRKMDTILNELNILSHDVITCKMKKDNIFVKGYILRCDNLKHSFFYDSFFKIIDTWWKQYLFSQKMKMDMKKFIKAFSGKILQSKDKGELKISLPMDPLTLDPRKSGDIISFSLIFMLYNGLMEFKEDGEIGPSLAKSYKMSHDEKTYVFYLKDNIKWSDGKEITAYDFEASWKKILDPGFSSLTSHLLYPIYNAKKANKGEISLDEVSIKAKDKKTLVVKLQHPTPYFLYLTSFCGLFAVSSTNKLVSSGPFLLEKWNKGKEIILKKNPYYWNKDKIFLNSIYINIEDRKVKFKKGNLDWTGALVSLFSKKIIKFDDKDKKRLRISFHMDPLTLDPRKNGDIVSSSLIFMLYDGLMEYEENGKVVPSLIKSYEISDDEKRYVFHFKDNIKWSDGKEITAYDFEASWKKILDPNFPSLSSHLLNSIYNAEKAYRNEISIDEVGIKALDKKTLEVKLKNPFSHFLYLTSFCGLFPVPFNSKKQISSKNLVSNGPFRLKKWIRGKEILLEKNPYYWNKENVHLEFIHISIIKDGNKRLKLFQDGKLDWAQSLISPFPLNSDILEKNKKNVSIGGITFCAFNTNIFPFNNKNMRKAFGLAIDRKKIIKMTKQEEDQVAFRCFPPCMMNKNKVLFKDNDIKKAKKLFQLGLDELNVKRKDLNIVLSCSDEEVYRIAADIIKKSWEEVFGISVKLEKLELKIFKKRLFEKQFQSSLAILVVEYNDIMNILDRFKYRKNSKNYSGWENEEFIELLEKIPLLKDKEKSIEKAEKLLMDEMPFSPIYHHNKYLMAARSNVKDILIGPVGNVLFTKVKIN